MTIRIDFSGPQGNAYMLMAQVQQWGKQLGVDTTATIEDMMSGDYEHLLRVMARWAYDNGIDLDLVNQRAIDEIDKEDK